jgi:transcriptional regulator with XRE-family HTH domain
MHQNGGGVELEELGARVRSARRALGWTQTALGERAGVSRAQIDRLENGRLTDIGYKPLQRLLACLGLELRVGDANRGRPTLDELARDEEGP